MAAQRGLSELQHKALVFICGYFEEHGVVPSLRRIALMFDPESKSNSSAVMVIDRLCVLGYLERHSLDEDGRQGHGHGKYRVVKLVGGTVVRQGLIVVEEAVREAS